MNLRTPAKIVANIDKSRISVEHPGAIDLEVNQYKSLGGTFDGTRWSFPASLKPVLETIHEGFAVSAKSEAEAAKEAEKAEKASTNAKADKAQQETAEKTA
jgi:hypothetical protein